MMKRKTFPKQRPDVDIGGMALDLFPRSAGPCRWTWRLAGACAAGVGVGIAIGFLVVPTLLHWSHGDVFRAVSRLTIRLPA